MAFPGLLSAGPDAEHRAGLRIHRLKDSSRHRGSRGPKCTFPIWQEWAGKVSGELGVRAASEPFLTAAAGKRNWPLREALPRNQLAEVTLVLKRSSTSSTQVTMAEMFPEK